MYKFLYNLKKISFVIKNNKFQSILIFSFISIILLNISLSNHIYPQNSAEIKYYKNIDKTHYYVNFINEIPYFRVNRYNSYYEVLYNSPDNERIDEVIVYKDTVRVENWIFKYPNPGEIIITYKNLLNNENQANNNENTNQTNIMKQENYYYNMGRLIKKETYNSDLTLDYYFNISYQKGKKAQEYYFNSNGSYIYKFYYYDRNNNLINNILREGVIVDKNRNKIQISEKWIYKDKQVSIIEIYKNSLLHSRYYLNEYSIITKKENYNNMSRVSEFYSYEYFNDLKINKVKIHIPIDTFTETSNQNSRIIKEYIFSKDNTEYIEKTYENNNLKSEKIYNYITNRIRINTYNEAGNIINVKYKEITKDFEHYRSLLNPQNDIHLLPPDKGFR